MGKATAILLIGTCTASAHAVPARFELDPGQSVSVMNRRLLDATTFVPLSVGGSLLVDTAVGGQAAVSGVELDLGQMSTLLQLGPYATVDVGVTPATLRSVGVVSLSATPGPVPGQTLLGTGVLTANVTGSSWHSAMNLGCVSLEVAQVPCAASIGLASPGGRPVEVTGGVLSGPPGGRTLELRLALRVPLPGAGSPWGEHLVVTTVRAAEVATTPACRADFNGSGVVEVSDIFAFLSAWFASDLRADVNDDGSRTVSDIFAFLTLWFARC
ncbi:MAG: hypothetical protein K2Q20_05735 [Phycisphaerales bacterium]|nr:hypothetical protein [Phycisphaerales bacterium]